MIFMESIPKLVKTNVFIIINHNSSDSPGFTYLEIRIQKFISTLDGVREIIEIGT